MIEDAIDAVLSVADQWRGTEEHEVDADALQVTYLAERLGLERNEALFANVVAE